jgi:hypothetical protein
VPRTLVAAAVAALTCSLAGCIGADANRAQALLQQAHVAAKSVSSEGFVMRISIDAQGRSGGFALQGGAQLKGAGAGDFYLTGMPTGEMATSASKFTFTAVRRGSLITLRTPSGTRTVPVPQAQSKLGTNVGNPTKLLDLAQYVKSVSVDSTQLDGTAVDRIVGKLDTGKLIGSVGNLEKNGLAKQLFEKAGVHFGDIRAVLFLARDTHLVKVMFADMAISAQGKQVHIHLSIALNRINQPVAFPDL